MRRRLMTFGDGNLAAMQTCSSTAVEMRADD